MPINTYNLFVDRLYRTCLERAGEQEGQEYWVRMLLSQERNGIECAWGFVNSTEFRNNGYSDEVYVEKMYEALLGRPSDKAGKTDWVKRLKDGMTREELFSGFANSPEFAGICEEYGIKKE